MNSVILISVDALRADHLGQYGYARHTMPVLDRLLSEGTKFSNAFSNAPYTRVSVPSFHTSNYVGYHDVEDRPTIASILSQHDVFTCVIGAHTGARSVKHGLGFDEYLDFAEDYYLPGHTYPIQKIKKTLDPYPTLFRIAKQIYDVPFKFLSIADQASGYNPTIYTGASDVTDRAIRWLENHQNVDFFLWIHYNDGHSPYGLHDSNPTFAPKISQKRIMDIWPTAYDNPDDLKVSEYKLLIDQYDSNLRYCSRHIDRLFDKLHELDLWDTSNIIFTSDHGEEFYEHGMFTHKNLPYDELINVPLIIHGPNIKNNIIREQRELIDIGPTVMDLCGITTPSTFEGRNLFDMGNRKVVAVGSVKYDGRVVAGRWDDRKFIWTDDREYLFDLKNDPLEEINIAGDEPDVCEEFRDLIPTKVFTTPPEEFDKPENEHEKKQLEALGYIQ